MTCTNPFKAYWKIDLEALEGAVEKFSKEEQKMLKCVAEEFRKLYPGINEEGQEKK